MANGKKTEVLSQGEIDDLLTTIDSSTPDAETAVSQQKPAVNERASEVVIYDFKRPERVSNDQMRSLQMLHEVLARKLGASLSSYLRDIVEVKLASVEQLTYSEFIMSLPNPTCFNLISCEPLDGQMVLEINPNIVYPIIDKLLGGNKASTECLMPEREMSEIEWRLMARTIDDTLTFLREAWQPLLSIDFKVAAHEVNPQLMQIVPPNEVVILVCLEVKMKAGSGMLNLCIPFPVVEPIMGNFSTIQTWFSTRRSNDLELNGKKLAEGVNKVNLEVVSYIAKTEISMLQFLNLKPGDIITTTKKITDDLMFSIDGKPKYMGSPGTFGKYRAFRVKRPANPADTI